MIEIGNVVTLENGKEFLLLEEVNAGTRRFVYAVRVLPDDTPTSEYVVFEAITIDNEEYLKDINDKELYDRVIEEFRDVIGNKMQSGEYNDMIQEIQGEN